MHKTSRQTESTTRLLLLRMITILIFAALAGQLAILQFVRGADYQETATYNRVRVVRSESARGVIYDRDGRMLARNTARFGIALVPASLPDDPDYQVSQQKRLALYEELLQIIAEARADVQQENNATETEPAPANSPLIAGASNPPPPEVLTIEEIDSLVAQREAGSAFQPVLVAKNLTREVALRVEEQRYRLPGVELQLDAMRDYPSGSDFSHVLGYMGPIPQETQEIYEEKGYGAGAWVGWAGLESTFEDVLRGVPGVRVIEVDVNGREKALHRGRANRPARPEPDPQPGPEELQKAMHRSLGRKGIKPEIVPIAPLLSPWIPATALFGEWSACPPTTTIFSPTASLPRNTDSISKRLAIRCINHAVSGIYPPGSTFKLVPAAAGLTGKGYHCQHVAKCPRHHLSAQPQFPR